MLMMLKFVVRVWNCSFPHYSFCCGILKNKFFLKVFQRLNSSASQPMSFSFYLADLPFLWMTAEVALCHQNVAQCVCYNKKAGEEEVVRKLCPCSAVGIFQESTASSLIDLSGWYFGNVFTEKIACVFQTSSEEELHYQIWKKEKQWYDDVIKELQKMMMKGLFILKTNKI